MCMIVWQCRLSSLPLRVDTIVMSSLVLLPIDQVTAAASAVFEAHRAPADHISLVTDNLIQSDRRGIHTHGIARVRMYVNGLVAGSIDPKAVASMEYGAPAASCWNANQAFGQVAMAALVDHACTQAKVVGSHIAVVHGSNHFGYAGHWVRRAADRGLVAMAFTSGGPLVIPTGGVRAELGTNPLAMAIRGRRDEIVVDMSTSTVAMGKLEHAHRAGRQVPDGWAVDGSGNPLNQPSDLIDNMLTGEAGGLLPLGGSGTEHGGHKGYGMGLLVEVLSTVLSGGGDLRVTKAGADRFAGHVSHSVIVLDPAHLAGVEPTQRALDAMTAALRGSPPIDPDVPVRVPGDPEREWESRTGPNEVLIESDCWDDLRALATAANTIRVAAPSDDVPIHDRGDESDGQ